MWHYNWEQVIGKGGDRGEGRRLNKCLSETKKLEKDKWKLLLVCLKKDKLSYTVLEIVPETSLERCWTSENLTNALFDLDKKIFGKLKVPVD